MRWFAKERFSLRLSVSRYRLGPRRHSTHMPRVGHRIRHFLQTSYNLRGPVSRSCVVSDPTETVPNRERCPSQGQSSSSPIPYNSEIASGVNDLAANVSLVIQLQPFRRSRSPSQSCMAFSDLLPQDGPRLVGFRPQMRVAHSLA